LQESPERITRIHNALLEDGTHEVEDAGEAVGKSKEVFESIIKASHDPGYLEHLEQAHNQWLKAGLITEDECILPECFRTPMGPHTSASKLNEPPKDIYARTGYYAFDMSTGISKGSWKSIRASAWLAYKAAHHVVMEDRREGKVVDTIFALCRPPGHHCDTNIAGGYCYINNAVIAVETIKHYAARRQANLYPKSTVSPGFPPNISILDIDFHHGNGTQDKYYANPRVQYVSIHGEDEFPYWSGFATETGTGAGAGKNVNRPLAKDSSFKEYVEQLNLAVEVVADFQPTYLVVSLGFDTFREDPLGSFDIKTEDYETIGRIIRSNDALKGIPAVILLEGGYVLESLGENVLSFLRGWTK
jgi:acetoin utilization deacetylase AcuC-like enzyme